MQNWTSGRNIFIVVGMLFIKCWEIEFQTVFVVKNESVTARYADFDFFAIANDVKNVFAVFYFSLSYKVTSLHAGFIGIASCNDMDYNSIAIRRCGYVHARRRKSAIYSTSPFAWGETLGEW